mmetsp:Transcript_6837/g.18293  ORF Transcript_6837/g.18293 Transcript_6837/m.18293 type:complete len:244 (-) Transcript_6837:221-952(-)
MLHTSTAVQIQLRDICLRLRRKQGVQFLQRLAVVHCIHHLNHPQHRHFRRSQAMFTHSFFQGALGPFSTLVLNHFHKSLVAAYSLHRDRHYLPHRRQIHHSVKQLTQSGACERNKCQCSPNNSHRGLSFHMLPKTLFGILKVMVNRRRKFDNAIHAPVQRILVFSYFVHASIHRRRVLGDAINAPIYCRNILSNTVHAPIHRRCVLGHSIQLPADLVHAIVHRQRVLYHAADELVRLAYSAAQ